MTDREMLELAAKAAGYRFNQTFFDSDIGILVWEPPVSFESRDWNPLKDDGDAFRLAVKLHLNVFVGREATGVNDGEVPTRKFPSAVEPHETDPDEATRRAIVRAAAEIGKAMK